MNTKPEIVNVTLKSTSKKGTPDFMRERVVPVLKSKWEDLEWRKNWEKGSLVGWEIIKPIDNPVV